MEMQQQQQQQQQKMRIRKTKKRRERERERERSDMQISWSPPLDEFDSQICFNQNSIMQLFPTFSKRNDAPIDGLYLPRPFRLIGKEFPFLFRDLFLLFFLPYFFFGVDFFFLFFFLQEHDMENCDPFTHRITSVKK